MEVSPNVLRRETVAVLKDVNEDLMRDQRPEVRATLLHAKATCLNTLVLLREERKK